ncbi:MAG: hypothetical protein WCK67_07885 [bacterium]
MNSLLDGYEESKTTQSQENMTNSSLLDGYVEPKQVKTVKKTNNYKFPDIHLPDLSGLNQQSSNNQSMQDIKIVPPTQYNLPVTQHQQIQSYKTPVNNTELVNNVPQNAKQVNTNGLNYTMGGDDDPFLMAHRNKALQGSVSKKIDINQGIGNILNSIGKGILKTPESIVGFGKNLINDTETTAKNIWNEPSLLPLTIPAMGKGMVDGLIHDVIQGVADIPEALSSAYQGKKFEENIHVPTFTEGYKALIKKLNEKGIYPDKQYDRYLKLQKYSDGQMSKLPIFQTAGQFMLPVGEVKEAMATGGVGKAMLHGAGFGAVMPGGLEDKISNAGTGALMAGGLGIVDKAGVPIAETVKKIRIPLEKILKEPTAFDKMKSLNIYNGKINEITKQNIQHSAISNELNNYNNLVDAYQKGEYSGQKLDNAQLKAVKRRIYQIEDSIANQSDFINNSKKPFDSDTLNLIKSNIQGRFKTTPIQDGYNVYGVPVDPHVLKGQAILEQTKTAQIADNLKRAELETQQNLARYKQKLIEQGKIKAPESLLDGYSEELSSNNELGNNIVENNTVKDTNSVDDVNPIIDNPKEQSIEQPVNESESTNNEINPKYNFNVGPRDNVKGFSKEQREYIAKTVLDEYKGDLFHDVKTEHLMDTEQNPKIKTDEYHRSISGEVINLNIPNTNTKFTLHKDPQAIRTLFDRLGIKINPQGLNTELYQNSKNPSYTFAKNDTPLLSDGYIVGGNQSFVIKPELLNIKNPEILKRLAENKTDNKNIKSILQDKANLSELTDKNRVIGYGKTGIRIFENSNGERIYVNSQYAKLFDNYRLYQDTNRISGLIHAINKNGEVVGAVAPIQFRDENVKTSDEMPYQNQSKFENKTYKSVEPAQVNLGKNTYDKTGESSFNMPRTKLETITDKKREFSQQKKAENIKNLETAKEYTPRIKEAVRKWHSDIETQRYDVNKTITEFINHSRDIAKETGLNDKNIREIMPFLRERTELPNDIGRPDLVKTWDKLTNEQKNELRDYADNISEEFQKYWDEYQQVNGKDTEDANKQDIENYVTHIWDLDKKQIPAVTNYFSTRSRFAKERTIETLFDGIQGLKLDNGEVLKLKPKTLDYAELLKIQSDSLIKATVDKKLAEYVKGLKTGDGIPLVLPAHKAPSDWVSINHPAINKTIIRPIDTAVGEVMTPELQNILAEMGVAVGRRLNSNGKTLGVYKTRKATIGGKTYLGKEISLKKWFSNKTLAHEIGHAIDKALELGSDFAIKHKQELADLNEERIKILSSQGKSRYANSHSEQIAELFGFLFNDPKMTSTIAPKATADVLARMSKSETFKKLLPENFDWSKAKNVLEEKTVEMFKSPVKVHPDIAEALQTVFETPESSNKITRIYDNLNAVQKQFNLGFSGFHGMNLSESALASLGVKDVSKILNPAKIFNSVKNNDWEIYKKDELARNAIKDGVQLGATLDIHRKLVEDLLDNTANKIDKMPIIGKYASLPAKILSKGQELNNKVLWDYLHNQFKLTTYENLIDEYSRKGSLSSSVRKEIGQWVNDNYGGQVWENLGIKPSSRRLSQRLMLSPDWFVSTTRHFLGMLSTETGQKFINAKAKESAFWEKARDVGRQWGIGSITDDVTSAGIRGRIARRFWTRALLNYALYANALNAINRQHDKEENPDLYPKKMNAKDYSIFGNSSGNETYVFLGRNSDGTERYWRLGKQFREVPELVEKPFEKLGGKASPVMQLASQAMTGRTLSGFENPNLKDKKGIEKVGAMTGEVAKSFLPFSFNGVVDPKKDINPYEFFAPTNKGMNFYKGKELYIEAIKHKDKNEVIEITKQIVRNKMDPNKIFNQALKDIRKEAYKKAMQKVELQKQGK